jgi:spore coat protein JB
MTVELNLYLDTHPRDQRALRDYNAYTQHLMMLKNEYQRRYGVLTNFGNAQSQYPWSWINEPWPWEEY